MSQNPLESWITKVTLAFGLLSTLLCLVYTIIFLKLNKYIKAILVLICLSNLINLILANFSTYFLNLNWQCEFSVNSLSAMSGTYTMTSFISMVRILMAKKASKAKLIPCKIMSILIFTFFIVSYGISVTFINLKRYFGYQNIISLCQNEQLKETSLLGTLITVSVSLGILGKVVENKYYIDF